MEEKISAVPENAEIPAEGGGISFSGGSENAFIKEYAASPVIERTIEDIEEEEQKVAEKQAEIRERTARRREKLENKKRASYAPVELSAPEADKEPSLSPDEADEGPSGHTARFSFDAELFKSQADTAAKEARERAESKINVSPSDLVQPVQDEDEAENRAQPEEQKKLSRFARLFSESRGFSALSLLFGTALTAWDVAYIVTVIVRDVLFTRAVSQMEAQGVSGYSVQFSSPALTVLRLSAYLILVLILVWVIVFRVTDGKNRQYNKKTIIVILCLIALTAVIAVFDVAAAHLVMT